MHIAVVCFSDVVSACPKRDVEKNQPAAAAACPRWPRWRLRHAAAGASGDVRSRAWSSSDIFNCSHNHVHIII